METMHLPIEQLRVGELIAEDIFANTKFPIVTKETTLTYEHLHIFEVFNIKAVHVLRESKETNEVDSAPYIDHAVTESVKTEVVFKKLYDETIHQFKKEFKSWEAGANINISKIRGMMLPIIELALNDKTIILNLNEYSTAKDYLYHHCIATGLITAVLAQKLGYDRGDTIQLAIGGTLADCGMSKVSSTIRNKKGALTENEFNEVRKHPIYTYKMIKDIPVLKPTIKAAVFQHHERLNGTGYPSQDRADKISKESQIIAIADVFHAMTSERMYRAKEPSFKVIEKIKEEEFGKFDITIIEALLSVVSDLTIGSKVVLSNLERGEVLYVQPNAPTRPLIKLQKNGEIIDLQKYRQIHIKKIIR